MGGIVDLQRSQRECGPRASVGEGRIESGSRPSRVAFDPVSAFTGAGLVDVTSPFGAHGAIASFAVGSHVPLVWVQDSVSRIEFGGLCARGMGSGIDPGLLISVRTRRARDVLWSMEEVLRAGLPVVGEIAGEPCALDFTATRRLEWRAREAGVPCWLMRLGSRAATQSSAARHRWRVLPYPSAPDPHDAKAPGIPRWVLDLTRAREHPPGRWIVEAASAEAMEATGERGATHRLRVVAALADGGVAAGTEAGSGKREQSSVLPFVRVA